MGGYFSTRWNSRPTRRETDPLLSLDIRLLKQWGALQAGAVAFPSWSSRGEPSGSIVTRMSADGRCLTLEYDVQKLGEDWRHVKDLVWLDWTECNYGGERPWFLCPRCHSRRGVLFSVGGRFRCRLCHNLAYSSTREDPHERSIRRCANLRLKLGGSFNQPVWTIPPKPAGMTWRRYRRLRAELIHTIEAQDDAFEEALIRLAKRFDKYA